jgi:hypothetical protein
MQKLFQYKEVKLAWCRSLGCEREIANESPITATALCALGASQQYFFKHARALIQGPDKITAAKVRSALLEVWTYTDTAQSFRWEPGEERSYARRFRGPSKTKESGNEIRTMHAANRLALEGTRRTRKLAFFASRFD